MHKHNKGFTLIEMLVVVAIIGILSAIAIPMYNEYVINKAHRQEVIDALITAKTGMMRYRMDNDAYTGATIASLDKYGVKANFGQYTTVTISSADQNSFVITASHSKITCNLKITNASDTPEVDTGGCPNF